VRDLQIMWFMWFMLHARMHAGGWLGDERSTWRDRSVVSIQQPLAAIMASDGERERCVCPWRCHVTPQRAAGLFLRLSRVSSVVLAIRHGRGSVVVRATVATGTGCL
jgi:hypothetical protein